MVARRCECRREAVGVRDVARGERGALAESAYGLGTIRCRKVGEDHRQRAKVDESFRRSKAETGGASGHQCGRALDQHSTFPSRVLAILR